MEKILLEVNNVKTSYGKFTVSNLSFHLKNKDILGLVGRSGAGKSTIVQTLIGLKKPVSGSITSWVDDKKVPLKDLVGYSPQENSLYPFLTLEENIYTFAKLYNVKKKEVDEKIGPLLRRMDLQNARKKRITKLSGGMQKRADLAVALIHSPKIIILDEPFNGLDISLQCFIWEWLRDLSAEGRIIIVSSHMLSDIQKNCNQFGLCEGGYFYNTEQIAKTLRMGKEKSLEQYLQKLFTRDLMSDAV